MSGEASYLTEIRIAMFSLLKHKARVVTMHHIPPGLPLLSWQDEHLDSSSLVSVFLSTNWDDGAPLEAFRMQASGREASSTSKELRVKSAYRCCGQTVL